MVPEFHVVVGAGVAVAASLYGVLLNVLIKAWRVTPSKDFRMLDSSNTTPE